MRQIIALGGGGFSMEPENFLLDKYILDQSNNSNPKVMFLPTASGDADNYIERFYQSFRKLECIPSHLSLFKPPMRDIQNYILEKDIIYVGGGNTKNMLALWRDWEIVPVLERAWNSGIVLAGISAGSICWFEEGATDSYGEDLEMIKALGFLKGSNCPHYDGEKNRRPIYQYLIESQQIKSGYGVDDGVALHFVGTDLQSIVSSRPSSSAYKVFLEDNKVMEKTLKVNYLG
ncbi:Type 1 glutamine amidotransferase-like domain-containing protein [Oceanobacillus iheyensis]|uniref:Hypothetical conserved protein n=1 Tax=Oceanobacillus iheyensis (strain DSM 14371 / CIP 107618 / JCM 11309 / KCTC 3954 / HTE831) TaxID=221109 RepID=Q8ERL4_OCEIH|nr:peptidase E [Oceanobacillus iheyensis]BAC13244.1 hypothetical conserved protein [Oceanobacillus iheyensis HTE831]